MKIPAVLLSLALALLCGATAHAQGLTGERAERASRPLPPIEISLQAGFDHRSRGTQPGTWSPVSAVISNHTDHDLVGTLKLSTVDANGKPGGSRVSRDVKVAANRAVLVNSTVFVSPGDTRLEAAVTAQSGETGHAVEALLASPHYLNAVVVLGESKFDSANPNPTYPHDDLSRVGRDLRRIPVPHLGHVFDDLRSDDHETERMLVLQAAPHTMPDRWIAYAGVTAVLVTDPAAIGNLSEEQWKALRDYVSSGGRVVFEVPDAAAAARLVQTARLPPWLPALPGPEAKVDPMRLLRALQCDTSDDSFDRTPPVMSLVTPTHRPGIRRIYASDSLILVSAPQGLGMVTVIGFSLVDSRLVANERNVRDLARRILHPEPGEIMDFERLSGAAGFARQIDYELRSEELAQIPSHRVLLLFLVGYCLLVGPLNRVIFSLIRRPLAAWLAMPLIVAGFMGIALTKLSIQRPETPLLREVTVLQSTSGASDALARSYLSLYSPERATYRLESGPDAAIHYLVHNDHRGLDREALWFVEGTGPNEKSPVTGAPESSRLDALPLAPHSSANLSLTRRVNIGKGITISTEDQMKITNDTPYAMEGGAYWSNSNRQVDVPPLAPGETLTLETPRGVPHRLSDLTTQSPRDRRVLESVIERIKPSLGYPGAILWARTSAIDLKCSTTSAQTKTNALTFFVVRSLGGLR